MLPLNTEPGYTFRIVDEGCIPSLHSPGASARRRALVWAAWFFLGLAGGSALTHAWQRRQPADMPPRRCEATVYLPLSGNDGRTFPDDEWRGALDLLVEELGGATLSAPVEGYWRDDQGRVCREPVRPVIVSFEGGRLADFRRAVRQVGRRLGQEVLYVRFEQPRVELLPVATAGPEPLP